MKKLLITAIFFLTVSPAFALVRVGLEGGLSIANATLDPAVTTTARSGLAAGAMVELGVSEDFYLVVEALYVQRGYKESASGVETIYKQDYIDIPVQLKYDINLVLVKPFFTFGPYLGFLSKAGSETAGTSLTYTTGYKTTEFGLSLGVGAELPFSPVTSLFVSGRYNMGLTNVLDSSVSSQKSRGLIVMGGLLIGI